MRDIFTLVSLQQLFSVHHVFHWSAIFTDLYRSWFHRNTRIHAHMHIHHPPFAASDYLTVHQVGA